MPVVSSILLAIAVAASAAPKPTVASQAAIVKALQPKATSPAYAEALLKLAELRTQARDLKGALEAARQAATAFDQQVELHKVLSEVLPDLVNAKAERAAALQLGLRRDEAFFAVAEAARALGEDAVAVKHYVLLIQSQADQPRGIAAYAALKAMGWAAQPAGNPTAAQTVSPP